MTPEQRKDLLSKNSWLRNFGLSEGQIKHLISRMPHASAGLFVVGYVDAVCEGRKLPKQIEHDTIDAKLDPEPPDYAEQQYQDGRSAGQKAPSGAQDA